MEPKKDWKLTRLRDTLSISEYGKYKFYAKDLENIKLIMNDVEFKKTV